MTLMELVRSYPLTDAVKVTPNSREPEAAKPFLHWVGGKREFISRYPDLLPTEFDTYYEPFLGGGAMMFHLKPHKAVLGDSNPELVRTYQGLRDSIEEVILLLEELQARHSKPLYLAVRALDRTVPLDDLNAAEVAARMIYLNRTCFNGLYRVNRKGQFNSSIGYSLNKLICNPLELRVASQFLQRKTFLAGDFTTGLHDARAGDFVFLDPPYAPLGGYSDFVRYTKEQFNEEDQRRLAASFAEVASKGAKVMMTNSSAPLIYELYEGFKITPVGISRSVSSAAATRGDVEELVITNY